MGCGWIGLGLWFAPDLGVGLGLGLGFGVYLRVGLGLGSGFVLDLAAAAEEEVGFLPEGGCSRRDLPEGFEEEWWWVL